MRVSYGKIGNWEPKTPAEKAVVAAIGLVVSLVGIGIALLAVFGVAMPAVILGLSVAGIAVVIAVVVGLGAVLLPIVLLLAPVALIVWGIVALIR